MKALVLACLLMVSCTTKQFVRDALTVQQMTCALLQDSYDVEAIRIACGIAEALRPYLIDLVTAKANAARIRAQTR